MKISKLHIDSFRHLENLDFDFTYPEDFHDEAKRGRPLDKICFIGQSATGKTGLLELIYNQFSFINNLFISAKNQYNDSAKKSIEGSVIFNSKGKFIELNNEKLNYNGEIFFNSVPKSGNLTMSGELLKNPDEKKSIYFFRYNVVSESNLDFFSKNPIDIIEKYNEDISDLTRYFKYSHNREFVFNENVEPRIWLFISQDILNYRKKFNQKMSELIHKGLLANQNKLQTEFENWQKENPNTLELFAQKFNPILEKLNLEVDVFNTEYSIPIKNKKNDEVIPIQNTSTGTKGLLLSFLPLFKLDTKDAIILIDEPERSLYPDMQMDLMEYYQNLAPEAQFIVATHSPFVAASFEPEERFILYFDEDGKVAVRRGSSPIGDDPNDILKNDFGINYYNKYGEEAYKKYIKLKEEVAKESNPARKRKLLLETVKLGDTYNF